MKKWAFLVGALVALIVASWGSATHSPWPDARHGWEVHGDVDTGGLYSTEDGGRTWHLIYPANGSDIMGFLRTSSRSGVISIDYKHPVQYWTRDNGRHWHVTPRLPAFWAGGWNLAGKRRSLFWSHAHSLYQVANWPPRRRTALRLQLVHRVADGSFADLAWIPGGVTGVVLRAPGSPATPLARVLIQRQRKYLVRLQDPDPASAARVSRTEAVCVMAGVDRPR